MLGIEYIRLRSAGTTDQGVLAGSHFNACMFPAAGYLFI